MFRSKDECVKEIPGYNCVEQVDTSTEGKSSEENFNDFSISIYSCEVFISLGNIPDSQPVASFNVI